MRNPTGLSLAEVTTLLGLMGLEHIVDVDTDYADGIGYYAVRCSVKNPIAYALHIRVQWDGAHDNATVWEFNAWTHANCAIPQGERAFETLMGLQELVARATLTYAQHMEGLSFDKL